MISFIAFIGLFNDYTSEKLGINTDEQIGNGICCGLF